MTPNKTPTEFVIQIMKTKRHTKSTLPEKVCKVCQKSFAWRKKWETVWEQVQYCSERCRRNKKTGI